MAALLHVILSSVLRLEPERPQSKYDIPVPELCHATLNAEHLGDREVFIIGDVHGCFDELCQLLEAARQKCQDPFVVFVGDMINKGPKSVDVLRLVQEMTHRNEASAVRGNHEECVLRELWAVRRKQGYILPERYQWVLELTEEDFQYLQGLPYTLSIPSKSALVVHAGLIPGLPLERQSLVNLTHMRNIIEEDFFHGDGFVGSSKLDQGVPWASLWPGPEHVYFGHDAVRGLQNWSHATGLDTGCLYGNSLSGVFIGHEQNPLSVKALKMYRKP